VTGACLLAAEWLPDCAVGSMFRKRGQQSPWGFLGSQHIDFLQGALQKGIQYLLVSNVLLIGDEKDFCFGNASNGLHLALALFFRQCRVALVPLGHGNDDV